MLKLIRRCAVKTLVIVPAYNEAENIKKVIEDLEKNLCNYDYIVIDDCSTDKTKKF
nr:glycosyltransferase [Holdemania sp. 1001095H_141210_F2]